MNVCVTGGTGLIARYVIYRLHEEKRFHLYVVVSSGREDFAKQLYKGLDDIEVINVKHFFEDSVLEKVLPHAYVVHTAFTRKNDGIEIARSQEYAYRLFTSCKAFGAKGIINMSSRSVYLEPMNGELNTESSPVNCDSLIATAKYGSELLLSGILAGTSIKYTSLRCASVNELKTDNNMVRPLNVFVDCVLNNKPITVFNGNQIMSFVDPRDVAQSVFLICSSSCSWKPVYNVGPDSSCTCKLIDMARKVIEIGLLHGYADVGINIVEKEIRQSAGLDSSLIREDFGYMPEFNLDMMISDLFKMKKEKRD